MKVLFVSSGKSGSVSDVIKNQGQSLTNAGIMISYLVIKPGIIGYITAILKIKRRFREGNFDLVHAHYSLSAISASLAGCFPLVVSLMGSDIFMSGFLRLTARFFYRTRWNATIVKTKQMKELLMMWNAFVIPNGVDLNRFKPGSRSEARKRIGYPDHKKLIIFISIPDRPEKNFELATNAVRYLNNKDVELMQVYNVANEMIPDYMNAADLLLVTSKWEGSINVVKEGMACNCPIVSTRVGDVSWIFGETEGCYLTSYDFRDIAEKINTVFTHNDRTEGRTRIQELELDSENVALKVIEVYKQVTEKFRKQ